jgi:hypothetical protein
MATRIIVAETMTMTAALSKLHCLSSQSTRILQQMGIITLPVLSTTVRMRTTNIATAIKVMRRKAGAAAESTAMEKGKEGKKAKTKTKRKRKRPAMTLSSLAAAIPWPHATRAKTKVVAVAEAVAGWAWWRHLCASICWPVSWPSAAIFLAMTNMTIIIIIVVLLLLLFVLLPVPLLHA